MPANQQEWLQLQQSYDQMEKNALWLRLLCLSLWLWLVQSGSTLVLQAGLIGFCWLNEALWKAQQDRAGTRLLALEAALREAFAHDGPVLVDVVSARQELVMPPTKTFEQAKGFSLFMLKTVMDGRARLRAERVGFVFQSFQLLDNLNALENVMLPLELEGRSDARQRASALLERVGLGQRFSHYPRQLSGGEQQRVAIARAFAAEPAILFADEPTGNLDSHTGERISDLLFELNKERGTTLVLVTHDERLAHRCRRLIRLEAGLLVAPLEP